MCSIIDERGEWTLISFEIIMLSTDLRELIRRLCAGLKTVVTNDTSARLKILIVLSFGW